ncbi:hypothetical protein REC12_03355 [Desulfosporosinus sp. PR]|nr:hypothetical protein [Desulfosporosinus sp. PR]
MAIPSSYLSRRYSGAHLPLVAATAEEMNFLENLMEGAFYE